MTGSSIFSVLTQHPSRSSRHIAMSPSFMPLTGSILITLIVLFLTSLYYLHTSIQYLFLVDGPPAVPPPSSDRLSIFSSPPSDTPSHSGDQDGSSYQGSSIQGDWSESSNRFQPFDRLPDEILDSILDQVSPFQRCVLLSVCKKWNEIISQRRSFFQYLTVPLGCSISKACLIVEVFNARSNFTLKHITLENRVVTADLDELFTELQKSSKSLKSLYLYRATGFDSKVRRMVRESLPMINELICHSDPWAIPVSSAGPRFEIPIRQEKGLQFLSVRGLRFSLRTEDSEWFRELKVLSVGSAFHIKDLAFMLESCCSNLHELRLQFWEPTQEMDEEMSLPNSIALPKLASLWLSSDEKAAKMLSSIIDITQMRPSFIVKGHLLSLSHLRVTTLKLAIVLLLEHSKPTWNAYLREWQVIREFSHFVKAHPFIQSLIFKDVPIRRDGHSPHLDSILSVLIIPAEERPHGVRATLLPDLKYMAICGSIKVNPILLQRCWRSRRDSDPEFEMDVFDTGADSSYLMELNKEWVAEGKLWGFERTAAPPVSNRSAD